jgi:hypothetical protein
MTQRPWVILLCNPSDVPPTPGADVRWAAYLTHYPQDPTGPFAYWSDMLNGTGDLEGSRIFGWYDLGRSKLEVAAMTRSDIINLGIAVAPVDVSRFFHIIVVVNIDANAGKGARGVLFAHPDSAPFAPTFEFHEMGHEFGLDHSFGEGAEPCLGGDGRPGAYCDQWDIMSAAVDGSWVHSFIDEKGRPSGPGLNGPNLQRLGGVSPSRVWTPPSGFFVWSLVLESLRRHDADKLCLATFVDRSMDPAASDFSTYFLEYRHPEGWDRGLPNDTVLIHEVRFSDGLSRLLTNINGGQLQINTPFTPPGGTATVLLNGIDAAAGTAALDVSGTVLCKIMARSSRKVLDIPSANPADGVRIQQWSDNGGTNQHWVVVNLQNGFFKIVSRATGKVLDVTGGPAAIGNGVPIQQWSDNGGTNQQWDLRIAAIDMGNAETWFKFISRSSGKVLDVIGGSGATADGVQIQQWSDNGGTNQQWLLLPVRNVCKIVSQSSGKVLAVEGGPFGVAATADGAPIQQWSDNGGTNQHWWLVATTEGYFKIVSESSGKVLDVTGGPAATADGVRIQQWSDNGGTNQQWQLVPAGAGMFTVRARSSGKVLDITGGPASTGDGVPIQQWSDNGGTNQQWTLVPIDN